MRNSRAVEKPWVGGCRGLSASPSAVGPSSGDTDRLSLIVKGKKSFVNSSNAGIGELPEFGRRKGAAGSGGGFLSGERGIFLAAIRIEGQGRFFRPWFKLF